MLLQCFFWDNNMDDKEYYSMKRITSVDIVNMYSKKAKSNSVEKKGNTSYGEIKIDDGNFLKMNSYQGHDDAEMLLEKQKGFDSSFNENPEADD